ncbi:hypothetical protein [Methylophaga sp.]|uniref:hypothetical protein n=1 Tax=Methylophaga sp. TaxID=2024840 RepID=UPI003A92B1AB
MHKLGGTIDSHEHIRLTFSGANFTDIDMQVANRIAFELWFIRCFLGLTGDLTDTVTHIQAVQAGARQMRNKALERKEAAWPQILSATPVFPCKVLRSCHTQNSALPIVPLSRFVSLKT